MKGLFQTYKDMIKKRQLMDRLTGTMWCAVIDECIELDKKISALEAAMADLIEIASSSVERVERSQRDTGVIRCEYEKVRGAVEYLEDAFGGDRAA